MYITTDDLRQSYVVAKNEVRKFVRGKKFTFYVAFIAFVFALITFLPYLLGGDLGDTAGEVVSKYVGFISLLALFAATLFASVTIVSEFEERTALILFTRPIKKTSIFVGKVIGCIVLESVMIVILYAFIALAMYIVGGGVSAKILTSLGLALLFVFAASSVAVLISSVMKKGSTSAIFTFLFLLLILPIISAALSGAGMDTWFVLSNASDSIAACIPEYVDMVNEMLTHMGGGASMDLLSTEDLVKAVATMVGWSVASLVIGWIAFIRREF